MTRQLINPERLPTLSIYTHVVAATGTTMVFANLSRALAGTGAA